MRIPLSKPALLDPDIDSAAKIIKSGQIVSGRAVEAFERQLATYVKTKYAVCVSSGTAALHLGLLALGIGPGDDVIMPAFSYPASANAVEVIGARPIFIDSEQSGFNIDTSRIENSITSRARAIIIVHNFGWPVEINKVRALSAKYDIPVIEDAACALGSSLRSERCGNLGRLGVFSFHPRKILTTGEGGAVVTDDLKLAETIRKLRNHGQDFSHGVDFVMPGLNYRMTEIQAALGISQMKRYDSILQERIKAAGYYNNNLGGMEFLRPFVPEGNRRLNYQTYVMYVTHGFRDKVIEHLKGNGIEAGIGTYSIPHTTYYSNKYGIESSRFRESLNAFNNLISLPLYSGITAKEQSYVIDILKKYKCAEKKSPERQTVGLSARGDYE